MTRSFWFRGCLVLGAAGLAALVPGAVRAQGFSAADTQIRFDGTSVSPAQGTARAGFTSAPAPGGGIVPVFVYQLPVVPTGQTITSATFSVNMAIAVAGSINYNVDLYALSFRASSAPLASDFFVGALDSTAGVTRIQDNFIPTTATPTTTPAGRYDTSVSASSTLAAFLNAQYGAGATGGAAGSFVFFRLSPDKTFAEHGNTFGGYDFSTQDNTAASGLRPTLNLTFSSSAAAPEPASLALFALAVPAAVVWRRQRKSR